MASEMTPGELVKELDRLREGARHEDSHSGAMIFESKARILVENEFDLILKSLRFAADMEVLRQDGLSIYIYPQTNGSVYLNYNGCDYHGSDIHSAARVAVEELKGRV